MAWEATTNSRIVQSGMLLHLVQSPSIVGEPGPALASGDDVSLELGNGSQTRFVVEIAGGTSAIIRMGNGPTWQISHWTARDRPVGIVSPHLYSQAWVIR